MPGVRKRRARQKFGDSVVVYRSGQLYEVDMVANCLEEDDVPFFRRQESSSGLSFAMPAAPTMGPGIAWAIVVPRSAVSRARGIIRSLPVSQDLYPGPWAFRPTPRVQKVWRLFASLLLALLVAGWLADLLRGWLHRR